LFEEKGPFKAHLLNLPIEACETLAGGIIGFFDLIHALLELNALSAVGFLD
jgi:hypothetical protein